jgi:hypothetical protein
VYVHVLNFIVVPDYPCRQGTLVYEVAVETEISGLAWRPGQAAVNRGLIDKVSPKNNAIYSCLLEDEVNNSGAFASCSSIREFSVRDAPMDINVKMLF